MKKIEFSSYDEYIKVQVERNKQKLSVIFATDSELTIIGEYIRNNIPNPTFGICHGVRNGYEVGKLRSILGIKVIGTDISETANRFKGVIQWDFHQVKYEWINSCDFIYSNSWDHSFDFNYILDSWMSCINEYGRLFLTWTKYHNDSGVYGADCFGASLFEMINLISKKYSIDDILPSYEFFARGEKFIHFILRSIRRRNIMPSGIPVYTLVVKHQNSQDMASTCS